MPNKRISQLLEVTTIDGTDVFAVVNGGATRKIKASNLAAFINSDTTVNNLSANWQKTYTNFSAQSANYATTKFVQNNFLPLSGGSIQGNFEVKNAGITNVALFVSALKIGINTETPNEELTVVGNISANDTIYAKTGNSDQWSSVHTTVQNASGSWNSSTLVNIFSSSGTWSKPPGAKKIIIECVAGGCGGGSGGKAAASTAVFGGNGGAAGGYCCVGISVSDLPNATYPITVGLGGTGAIFGGSGATSGGASSFGSPALARAVSGSVAGNGGLTIGSQSSGSAPNSNAGGMSSNSQNAQTGSGLAHAPSSGGAGGGCSTTTPFDGGSSGTNEFIGLSSAGTSGSATGSATNALSSTPLGLASLIFNGSGGGGGGATTFNGGSGGRGANASGYGCGGGGGGACSATTGFGGNGGNGASGIVVVTTYF